MDFSFQKDSNLNPRLGRLVTSAEPSEPISACHADYLIHKTDVAVKHLSPFAKALP